MSPPPLARAELVHHCREPRRTNTQHVLLDCSIDQFTLAQVDLNSACQNFERRVHNIIQFT